MAEIALIQSAGPNERWELAKQMGVTSVVGRMPNTGGGTDPWEFQPLLELKNEFADIGLSLDVFENRPPMDDVILGRDGRDEQIENVKTLLRNLGRVGVDVYCWAWMAPLGVLRTSTSVRGRGDSLTTRYRHSEMQRGPAVEDGIPEEDHWDNMKYFLDEVVPVAEEAGVKMALHPDDPPTSPVRGVGRIVTSVENYDRILDLHPSDHHGITFCQGNFSAMGADIPEAIRHFGDDIHFAHFRDVEGEEREFTETWHDEGPTDMVAAMQAYEDIDFEGSIRPDHVPAMAGEQDDRSTPRNKGRLFAAGYMRGLMQAVSGD